MTKNNETERCYSILVEPTKDGFAGNIDPSLNYSIINTADCERIPGVLYSGLKKSLAQLFLKNNLQVKRLELTIEGLK